MWRKTSIETIAFLRGCSCHAYRKTVVCMGHDRGSVPYHSRMSYYDPALYGSDITGARIIKKSDKEN